MTMRPQAIVLVAGWGLVLAWLGFSHANTPTNLEAWADFQSEQDPHTFDSLCLRGAFGKDGLP